MLSDNFSKSEMNVLKTLQESRINNEIKAVKIRTIAELSGLSYFSVRNIIKSFYMAGICQRGRRDGNADTFYIYTHEKEK